MRDTLTGTIECPWTSRDECRMVRERAVAGTDLLMGLCLTHEPIHNTDADCEGLIAADNICNGCGAEHADPCPECGGRGYHVFGHVCTVAF